jgi:hypothetical protein
MVMRTLTLLYALLLSALVQAQTLVEITNVKVTQGEQTAQGNNVTLDPKGQLNKAEGADRALIFESGDVSVKLWCKVSTHNSRRSSLKDSAVNMIYEIDMKAGKDKDNKRLERIFYLEESRKTTVKQKFTFKQGITMRVITLEFDAEIK